MDALREIWDSLKDERMDEDSLERAYQDTARKLFGDEQPKAVVKSL